MCAEQRKRHTFELALELSRGEALAIDDGLHAKPAFLWEFQVLGVDGHDEHHGSSTQAREAALDALESLSTARFFFLIAKNSRV